MAITPIPPNQPINGISQVKLAELWWQKVYSTPDAKNPIFSNDSTNPEGKLGTVKLFHSFNENSPVFFLVGTLDSTPLGGPGIERTVLPFDQPIFFPVVNVINPLDPINPGELGPAITETQAATNTFQGTLFATIDGKPIASDEILFTNYRQTSSAFFPVTNVITDTVPNGKYQAVQDGIYLGFKGNSLNGSTINFGGRSEDFNFSQNNTYNILNPVLGTSGNDIRFGTLKNDFIEGGQGKDILVGTAGNDLILGGSGSDIINGGRGNDELWGDASLKLRGGNPASDIFVYNGGKDKIFDFQLGSDKIFVSPLLPKPTINPIPETVNTKSSTQITFGNNTDNTLTLIGLAPGQVTPDIFIHTSPHSSASIV